MLSSQMEEGELVPLLIAAGGGGNAYLEDPESSQDHIPLEQYENSTIAPSANGQTGAAGTILYTIGHTTTNADVPLPVVASTHADTRDIAVLGSTYHSVRTDMYAHPILVYISGTA